jgi:hypothetical protein
MPTEPFSHDRSADTHFAEQLAAPMLDGNELQIVPDADQDAALPPRLGRRTRALQPYHLLWHERDVVALGDGRFRVRVPVIGACRGRALAARLDTMLTRVWVGRIQPSGAAITSVAVDAQPWNGKTHLTIVLTSTGDHAQRIDTVAMARDLRLALHQISLQDA